MKVAFVGRVLGADHVRGEKIMARNLSSELSKMGLEMTSFHSYQRRGARLRRLISYLTWDTDAAAVQHYIAFLKRQRPEVVLGWYEPDTSLVYACGKLRIPIVLTAHIYWLQCPYSFLTYHDTLEFCQGPQSYCGTDVLKWSGKDRMPWRMLAPLLGRNLPKCYTRTRLNRVNHHVKLVVACSNFMKSALQRQGYQRVRTIYNGVNTSEYAIAPLPRTPTVMFASQPVEFKGYSDFLLMTKKVRSEFQQCRFVVTGSSSKVTEVESTGWIPETKKPQLYAEASIVVFPSIWQEPFGLVLIEAMASGRPVVAYRSGAVSEIVLDGVTGFLVDRGDVKALSDKVLYLLRNPDVAVRMGGMGRERVVEHFDIRGSAKEYRNVLTNVVNSTL